MVSTIVPSKYKTDINILSNNLNIKPIPTPSVFYSSEFGKSQASAQIQQAANVRYSVMPAKSQTVLPEKALTQIKTSVVKSGVDTSKITIPIPTAQKSKSESGSISKTSSNNDIKISTDIKPQEVPSPSKLDILKTQTTAFGQDVVRGVEETASNIFDFGKMLIPIGIIAGLIILSKE